MPVLIRDMIAQRNGNKLRRVLQATSKVLLSARYRVGHEGYSVSREG